MRGEQRIKHRDIPRRWRSHSSCWSGGNGCAGRQTLSEALTLTTRGIRLGAERGVLLLQTVQLATQGRVLTQLEFLLQFAELLVEQRAARVELHGLPGECIAPFGKLGIVLRLASLRGLGSRRRGGFYRRCPAALDEKDRDGEGGDDETRFHDRAPTRRNGNVFKNHPGRGRRVS